jgi:hypothetical protein
MNFTIDLLIQQLTITKFFGEEEFNNFDLIEIGIRAARSFHCLGQTANKVEHTMDNGYQLKVNEYPDWFQKDVISIIARYVKARREGILTTTFDYNKKQQ